MWSTNQSEAETSTTCSSNLVRLSLLHGYIVFLLKKLSRSVLSLSTALLTLTNVASRRLLLIILNEVVHLVLFTRMHGNSFTMILGPSNQPHLPRVPPRLGLHSRMRSPFRK